MAQQPIAKITPTADVEQCKSPEGNNDGVDCEGMIRVVRALCGGRSVLKGGRSVLKGERIPEGACGKQGGARHACLSKRECVCVCVRERESE